VALALWLSCLAAPRLCEAVVNYVYDNDGRLIAVVDTTAPGQNAAIYRYDAVGNIVGIDRQSASDVAVLAFSPPCGPADTLVTIQGTGFSDTPAQNTVTFNGTTAIVESASLTTLVARVPAGATAGSIAVTAPGGSATSVDPFSLTCDGPVITSFSPSIGQQDVTEVTIVGLNFDTQPGGNVAVFNHPGELASGQSSDSTSLPVTVPFGGTCGRISVSTPLGKAVSAGDFFVAPIPYGVADVVDTGRLSFGQSRTLTINTAYKIALYVFEGVAGRRVSLAQTADSLSDATHILRPDGSDLTSPSYNFIDATPLTDSGTHTIFVESNASTGSETLSIYDVVDVTGTIDPGGPPVTVSTTVPGQNARFTFGGVAGQRVSLLRSNDTLNETTSILNPDGTTLVVFSGSSTFLEPVTLPTTGTYTILVDGILAATGSLTLSLYDVPDCGGPLTLTPSGSSATATITAPGQNCQFTFSATAGQKIAVAKSSDALAEQTLVLRPDGTTLATMSNTATFLDATTLPTTGAYTIRVDGTGTATGSVGVTLYEVPADCGGSLTLTPTGSSATATITTPGQNCQFTFSATAGQKIAVAKSSDALTEQTPILRPDGTTLATMANTATFLDAITLPTTGTYTIRVDGTGAATGSVVVTLYEVPADCGGGSLSLGASGSSVTATITNAGQDCVYTFSGTAGQRVSLLKSADTLSETTRILQPDGATLASTSSSFIDAEVLPASGTYTIQVDGTGSATGSVTITLYGVPADCGGTSLTFSQSGSTVTATVGTPGQNCQFTFSGTAGQRASLVKTSDTLTETTRILNPDTTTLASAPGNFLDAEVLPTTGTYTITVDGSGAATGSVTVTLYSVPADCGGTSFTPTPAGVSMSATVTTPGQNCQFTFTGAPGQRISVVKSSDTLNETTRILNPDGSTLVAIGSSFIDTETLAAAGTYIVIVDGTTTATGGVTLTVYDVPPDCGGTSLSLSPTGSSVTATIGTPGQNCVFSFGGLTNQAVSLLKSADSLSETTSIRKPDGSSLISSAGTFLDTKILPVDGTYNILVDGSTSALGSVTVTLYEVPADVTGVATINGGGVAVSIATPGQNGRLTFAGTSGQLVTVRVTGNTMANVTVKLLRPDDTVLTTKTSAAAAFNLTQQTLPSSGTYAITIDPSNQNTGSMTVSATSP
jgi:YD repeat-containing protein